MKRTDLLIERYRILADRYNASIAQEYRQDKTEILTLLTACKMCARAVTEIKNRLWTEYLRLNHQNEKVQRSGVTFLPAVVKLEELKAREKEARDAMAEMGAELLKLLDIWQAAGAAYEELLTFCNANYQGMKKQLGKFYEDAPTFSDLVFVHNLDYKNPRDTGFVENSVDAPLTHCVKEYFIKKILHDPAGKAAAHEAMLHFFPEVMEHAITVCMDEDGVQRLYDKDGECLGEVSE